jgi:RNA polymerase sigma-70 factor, ECF subfamily
MAREVGRVSERNPTRVEQALEWLQSGESSSVERAIGVLQEAVFGFGMKVCGNPTDAEDTAQETLVRLARSLKKFPNTRALSVWLYKVAKSQCLMSRRKSKFAPQHMLSLDELMPQLGHDDDADARSWAITPEEAVLEGEFRERLEKAIQALPKPYRLVLILRDMEQLDTREVAEVMEISEDTVKMRLHRARVFVRNELDKYLRQAAPRSA